MCAATLARSTCPLHLRKGRIGPFARTSRRYTRLSNGFSRKLENDAVALNYFAHNFIMIHDTLRMNPAMVAGVTDRLGGCIKPRCSGSLTSGGRKGQSKGGVVPLKKSESDEKIETHQNNLATESCALSSCMWGTWSRCTKNISRIIPFLD